MSKCIIFLSNLIVGYDCCYLYGSFPRNDSNCVPQGDQLTHMCTVYNPRDEFTNLTVRWLRQRTDSVEGGAMPYLTEIVNLMQGVHELIVFRPPLNSSRACTHGVLYMTIHNFTASDNGYYWCQAMVNDSYLQPSQNAWFYADSCTNHAGIYFRNANEPQCANTTYPTLFPPVMTSSSFPTTAPHTNKLTRTSMSSLTIEPNTEHIFYIVGALNSLALSLGTLSLVIILLLLLLFVRKTHNKWRKGETIVHLSYHYYNCDL